MLKLLLGMLRSKAASNALWIVICKGLQAVLGVIISVISARILGPVNYGLVNYAASLVLFVAPVAQLGMAATLVHEVVSCPDADHEGRVMGTAIISSLASSVLCILGNVTLKRESVVYATAGELTAELETDQLYAVAENKGIVYSANVDGGIAPYTICWAVSLEGTVMHEETYIITKQDIVTMNYMPVAFGEHEICLSVKDAVGTEKNCTSLIPVAVIECESRSQWEQSVSGVSLSGDWRRDLINVAKTQLGYGYNIHHCHVYRDFQWQ